MTSHRCPTGPCFGGVSLVSARRTPMPELSTGQRHGRLQAVGTGLGADSPGVPNAPSACVKHQRKGLRRVLLVCVISIVKGYTQARRERLPEASAMGGSTRRPRKSMARLGQVQDRNRERLNVRLGDDTVTRRHCPAAAKCPQKVVRNGINTCILRWYRGTPHVIPGVPTFATDLIRRC